MGHRDFAEEDRMEAKKKAKEAMTIGMDPDLDQMESASHLLPDPGGEVVRDLIKRLRQQEDHITKLTAQLKRVEEQRDGVLDTMVTELNIQLKANKNLGREHRQALDSLFTRIETQRVKLEEAKITITNLERRYLAEEIYASMITNEQWQSETGDVHENTLRRLASDAIQAVDVFNEVADGQSVNANKTSPREEGCDDESE